MPVVKSRLTVARLFGTVATGASTTLQNVTAELRAFVDGIELPLSPLTALGEGRIDLDPADSFADRENDQTKSWNFLLPISWTTNDQITLVGTIDPDNELGECETCTSNNRIQRIISFRDGNELRIQPLRILEDRCGLREPTDEEVLIGLEGIRRTFPYGQLTILPPQTFEREPGESASALVARLLDHFSNDSSSADGVPTYVIGFINLATSPPCDGEYCPGGMAFLNSPACISDWNPWTAAEELGHCFGQNHAGNSHCEELGGGFDPDYPDTHGAIDGVGFDTTAKIAIPVTPPYPANSPDLSDVLNCGICGGGEHTHDFMSYGSGPKWISGYTWRCLFESASASSAAKAAAESSECLSVSPSELLRIRGLAGADGAWTFQSFYTEAPGSPIRLTIGEGVLEARALSVAGEILATRRFNPRYAEDGSARVSTLLPFPEQSARITVVDLSSGRRLIERTVGRHPPRVELISPNGGETYSSGERIQIRWRETSLDRTELRYAVQWTSDDGNTWTWLAADLHEPEFDVAADELAGGSYCRVRVMATDGVLADWDTSDAVFTVTDKPPYPVILEPHALAVRTGELVILSGSAYDLEDGVVPDDLFLWKSSIDGVLGKGRNIEVPSLSAGLHQITLEVVDKSGNQAIVERELKVYSDDSGADNPVVNKDSFREQ